jgi:hypothetical protein
VNIAAQERKLIWPYAQNHPPDILISVGTGYNSGEEQRTPLIDILMRPLAQLDSKLDSNNFKDQNPFVASLMARLNNSHIEQKTTLIESLGSVDNPSECNRIWDKFIENESGPSSNKSYVRFHRFNLDLQGECPKFDEKVKLDKLRGAIKMRLTGEAEVQLIKQVARQLVASCFYFEKLETQTGDDTCIQGIWAIQLLQNIFYGLLFFTFLTIYI